MQTQITEIADRIYRLSTFLENAGSQGSTFNQFLIDAEESLLFHGAARDVRRGLRGDRLGTTARAPALDHVRTL